MRIVKPSWVSHNGDAIFSVDIHPDRSRFVTSGHDGKVIFPSSSHSVLLQRLFFFFFLVWLSRAQRSFIYKSVFGRILPSSRLNIPSGRWHASRPMDRVACSLRCRCISAHRHPFCQCACVCVCGVSVCFATLPQLPSSARRSRPLAP